MLADKAFVNSSVQTATANFRGNWKTFEDVPSDANKYPEDYTGSKTPTTNDYLVVEDLRSESRTEIRRNSDGMLIAYIVSYDEQKQEMTVEWTDGTKSTGAADDYGEFKEMYIQNSNYGMISTTEDENPTLESWKSFDVDDYENDTYFTAKVILGESGSLGTWRFKYVGSWATDGKDGWKQEYRVNETPMTAD